MNRTKKFAALAAAALLTIPLLAGPAGAAQQDPTAPPSAPSAVDCGYPWETFTLHLKNETGVPVHVDYTHGYQALWDGTSLYGGMTIPDGATADVPICFDANYQYGSLSNNPLDSATDVQFVTPNDAVHWNFQMRVTKGGSNLTPASDPIVTAYGTYNAPIQLTPQTTIDASSTIDPYDVNAVLVDKGWKA